MKLWLALITSVSLLATPVVAETASPAPSADAAFVGAFEAACVPQRLSYEGTKAQALAEGWVAVPDDHDPELARLMQKSRAGMTDPEYPDWRGEAQVYAKDVLGRPLYLIVTYLVAPEVMNTVGCYLYDFAATELIDTTLVTELIGKPIAHALDEKDLVSRVWGPPCPMPRTGDTYLTLVPEGSPYAEQTGFTGLALKFSTSEPDPGEFVPETFC